MNIPLGALKRLDKPFPFYSFLAAHSLLIGLLPFYLPVYLWQHQFQLADIALLISATGCGFVIALGFWQRAANTLSVKQIFVKTFLLEFLLIAQLLLWPMFSTAPDGVGIFIPTFVGAVILGIFSGVYNAWFWTTQRTLFLAMTGNSNTGRQYGNFQIFVTVFLKVGILTGGLLLDLAYGRWALMLLSIAIGCAMIYWYSRVLDEEPLIINKSADVTLASSFRYRDTCRSFPVFLVDGLFLFLESHFWLLSLFLVVQQDYSSLGATVVALAVFFAITFWLLKNTIDKFTGSAVFWVATALYACSWVLRAFVDEEMGRNALLINLMAITFFSSFFRLAFNKRFFDLARNHNGTDYLLVKSYLSQCLLAVFYFALALLLYQSGNEGSAYFQSLYLFAAALSLAYALYRKPDI